MRVGTDSAGRLFPFGCSSTRLVVAGFEIRHGLSGSTNLANLAQYQKMYSKRHTQRHCMLVCRNGLPRKGLGTRNLFGAHVQTLSQLVWQLLEHS